VVVMELPDELLIFHKEHDNVTLSQFWRDETQVNRLAYLADVFLNILKC